MRVFGAEIQPSFVVSSFLHEIVQQKQQQPMNHLICQVKTFPRTEWIKVYQANNYPIEHKLNELSIYKKQIAFYRVVTHEK